MNEPNSLENQLRSWMPRRPSASISKKLFGNEPVPERQRPALSWLAPATVGMFSLLTILGAHSHSSAHPGVPDTNLFFASITLETMDSFASADSPKNAFNLSKTDMNLEQNVWRVASFESTNRPQTHSSIRSLPVDTTNSLTR